MELAQESAKVSNSRRFFSCGSQVVFTLTRKKKQKKMEQSTAKFVFGFFFFFLSFSFSFSKAPELGYSSGHKLTLKIFYLLQKLLEMTSEKRGIMGRRMLVGQFQQRDFGILGSILKKNKTIKFLNSGFFFQPKKTTHDRLCGEKTWDVQRDVNETWSDWDHMTLSLPVDKNTETLNEWGKHFRLSIRYTGTDLLRL